MPELDGIGERLRLARIDAGLGLREAATFLEMSPRRLSDIENLREEPIIATAERMFRVYGYFEGRKIAGREFTMPELSSLWEEYRSRNRS
jgi:transcriptional regulator with XRE-family HTH domain